MHPKWGALITAWNPEVWNPVDIPSVLSSMTHAPFDPFDPPDFLLATARRRRTARTPAERKRSEAEYFDVCTVCGQAFDTRELNDVQHHGLVPHDPLPTN